MEEERTDEERKRRGEKGQEKREVRGHPSRNLTPGMG